MASHSLRLRPSTGLLPADHVALLAAVAEQRDGQLEFSSDGDMLLTLRGDEPATGLGPIPQADAHRVLVSPLTGRIGGHVDARELAVRLEDSLRRAKRPGLVGVDDGSGDIGGLGLTLVFAARDDREFAVLVDGADTGQRLSHGVDELTDWLAVIARHELDAGRSAPTAPSIPIGWLDQPRDGLVTLGAAVAGGVLDGRQLQFLAAIERPVVLTPWRTLLLCDLDEWAAEQVVRVLAPLGFVFDADSAVLADLG